MAFNNNKGDLEFPFDIIDVDPEINCELLRDFTGVCINMQIVLSTHTICC